MSTLKQRKAAAHARRMKSLKKKGLAGMAPGMRADKMLALLKSGGLIAVGALVGRELEHKVFKSNEKEGFKKWIGTLAKAGGAILMATQKNDMIRYIGAGLAAEVVLDTAGKVMKKDILGQGILSGLEGWDISGFLSGNSIDTYDELPPLEMASRQIAAPEAYTESFEEHQDSEGIGRSETVDYDEEIMI